MVKNPEALKKFEDDLLREEGRLPAERSWSLLDALWKEATALGHFPPKDPLEGIEVKIRIANVLNSCLQKSSPS